MSTRQLVSFRRLSLMLEVAGVLALSSCSTYLGVSRFKDTLYLAGTTSYFVYGTKWVKKCVERPPESKGGEPRLKCVAYDIRDVETTPSANGVREQLEDLDYSPCLTAIRGKTQKLRVKVSLTVDETGQSSQVGLLSMQPELEETTPGVEEIPACIEKTIANTRLEAFLGDSVRYEVTFTVGVQRPGAQQTLLGE